MMRIKQVQVILLLVLFACLLTALPASAQPQTTPAVTVSNSAPAVYAPATATNSIMRAPFTAEAKAAVDQEYKKLTDQDDEAQAEVDKWIRDNNEFAAKGAGVPKEELNRRIRERLQPIRKAYEDFLKRHPDHVEARVAFASFLGDLDEEEEARDHLERALTLDPKNPAIYNNLANHYSHDGPVSKAFEYYTKAIDLNPKESTYYHNLGMAVNLFRQDATNYFKITEQQALQKALTLYSNALRLDPDNFLIATDVAKTYYYIQPLRADEALRAWTNALRLAGDQLQREGVYIHLARIKMATGRLVEAREQLTTVTNAGLAELKASLVRNITQREQKAKETNAPPAESSAARIAPAPEQKRP